MSEIIKRGELPRRPIPGLVIRYSYLWHREAQEKRIEGLKSRPCAVVLSHSNIRQFPGRFVADVVPITHTRSAPCFSKSSTRRKTSRHPAFRARISPSEGKTSAGLRVESGPTSQFQISFNHRIDSPPLRVPIRLLMRPISVHTLRRHPRSGHRDLLAGRDVLFGRPVRTRKQHSSFPDNAHGLPELLKWLVWPI
jgi:hypothetical protein